MTISPNPLLSKESYDRLSGTLMKLLGDGIMAAMFDSDVIEIMLNPDGKIWFGTFSKGTFFSGLTMPASRADSLLRQIAAMLNTVITQNEPILECELPVKGSPRFEGLIPPVVAAPTFSIRKKAERIFTLDDYVRQNIISSFQREVLGKAVKESKNILVIGGTGTGKTTLVNALLHEVSVIAPHTRMIIIEDTAELQCALENKVLMKTSIFVDHTKLLKATMRLFPDRICLGELRGGEALALLKAWNSGHSGGFSTIHADGVIDGLFKLDEYVQEANPNNKLPMICRAVNYAVYIERTDEGRRVKDIVRINYYNTATGRINCTPIDDRYMKKTGAEQFLAREFDASRDPKNLERILSNDMSGKSLSEVE